MGVKDWQQKAARGTVTTIVLVMLAIELMHAASVFVVRYQSPANVEAHRAAQNAMPDCIGNVGDMLLKGFKRVCDEHSAWWASDLPFDRPYLRQILWQTWQEEWSHLGEFWSWLHPSGTFYAWCAIGFVWLNQHWALVGPTIVAAVWALVRALWYHGIGPCLDARAALRDEKQLLHQRRASEWAATTTPTAAASPQGVEMQNLSRTATSAWQAAEVAATRMATGRNTAAPSGVIDYWAGVPTLGGHTPFGETHIPLRDPAFVQPLPKPTTRDATRSSPPSFVQPMYSKLD